MNQAATLPCVYPRIVIALAVALILLAVTALLMVVEPGLMHAIRIALLGLQQMAPICPGTQIPCP